MTPRLRGRRGFTVVEMLIYIVIAGVVATSIYQLLMRQNRSYLKQREMQDVRTTLRSAGNLLAAELRGAASAEGDLYWIATDSIAIRSIQGTGTVCAFHNTQPRLGLWGVNGYFRTNEPDSALVLYTGSRSTADDAWRIAKVEQVWTSGGGVTNCVWADSATYPVETVIKVDTLAFAGLTPGAPFRAFRPVQYGVFEQDARWWLGAKVVGGDYRILTGPLAGADGVKFAYYDAAGDTTADPTQVRYIDIILRGESQGKVPVMGEEPAAQQDTLTIRVALRG